MADFVWHLECATFPTVFFFIDAEHAGTFITMLVFAIPINGAYYAVVGFVVWYLREGLRRLKEAR